MCLQFNGSERGDTTKFTEKQSDKQQTGAQVTLMGTWLKG